MSIRNLLSEIVTNPKIALSASIGTASAGVGSWLDVIPDDIGKLATLTGIALTSVLIVTHLRKMQLDHRKSKLDLEKAKLEIEEAKRRITNDVSGL